MRLVILSSIVLVSCASVREASEEDGCGVYIDTLNQDSWVTPVVVGKAVQSLLNEAEKTTDPRLKDRQANCNKLAGTRIVVRPEEDWYSPSHGFQVGGFAMCYKSYIVIGTPSPLRWQFSAIVHELFHVLQDCNALPGAIDFSDAAHEDWQELGINAACNRAFVTPDRN